MTHYIVSVISVKNKHLNIPLTHKTIANEEKKNEIRRANAQTIHDHHTSLQSLLLHNQPSQMSGLLPTSLL